MLKQDLLVRFTSILKEGIQIIQEKIANQKQFFMTNQTKDLDFRMKTLKKLRESIKTNEERILDALKLDLGKSSFEAYSSEVGFVLESINYFLRHIKKWAKPKRVLSPKFMPISTSRIHYEPHGTVLIMGPFNYPFQLIMEPMIGAIAAGNTCILKPSDKTPHTVGVIETIIREVFDPRQVDVITGNREVVAELIHSDFDYIFFTGSSKVGKIVMEAAAKKLTPVTLELGGKSPTIVHKDADIEKAAKRIVWGKFYNAGQTCIAPDYIYVHEDVEELLLKAIKMTIHQFYGKDPLQSPDYGKIINEKEFTRLLNLMDESKIFCGGKSNLETLKIAPTIMHKASWDDVVMAEEIFGPILPVLTYSNVEVMLGTIKAQPRPLALYLFTEDNRLQNKVLKEVPFGGGCINDTIAQVTSPRLPFGGTGPSGLGSYHGRESFLTFSHKKSIMKKTTLIDIKAMYPPYKGRLSLIKKIIK